MKVFLLPNPKKAYSLHATEEAAAVLADAGAQVIMESIYYGLGPEYALYKDMEKAWEKADVVVTLGGDGTILHAAPYAIRKKKPILGINVGHIGYMTAMEHDEMDKLRRLTEGKYVVEERSLLGFEVKETDFSGLALNDITFFKTAPERIIDIDIYCDETKVSSFRGDGVVFSTPTGSTAYSMSAGGPIVDARLHCIIATEICAHIVKMPPMVFAGDRVLRVVSDCSYDQQVHVSYDGRESRRLPNRAEAIIYQSEHSVPLVQFSDASQLEAIDKKLKGR